MNERVAVIGVGWAGFRPVTPEVSYKEMMYAAAVKAYDDAGVDPRSDVDSFITVAEDFIEGTSIFDEYVPDQLGAVLKPVHTIGGDGLHGLASGVMLIRTGLAEIVVIEGHSKASNVLTLPHVVAYAQDPVLNRPLGWETDFVAGLEMNRYLYECGASLEQCAMVVMKNRRNALRNPLASYGADLTMEEALGGDPLAWPLLDRHTAQHADGSVVMVLASEKRAEQLSAQPVWVTGVGWCNGAASLESREWGQAPYVQAAAEMAYRQAGIGQPKLDIDFVEIDDIYAYKELQTLEALGMCRPGEAGQLIEEGATEPYGEMPVNVSGGCLGVGDLLDANGLVRALEVVLQLRGEAGMRQLEDVEVGLAQSWRGVPTTSTAVAVFAV
ncbi:MAG: acetyl-CoA acetyltransferase [Anaerolineales bacterium]|nr:MAG: acetyl-CoA acetyltransferase [Anaerolineales bacterium]